MDSPLINYLQLFRPIPQEDKLLLIDTFQSRVFREGDDKGQEVTHYFLSENQFCTILNSFNNGVRAEETIKAACDGEVLAISRGELLALYEKIPYLQALIDQITHQKLLDKIQTRNAYLGQDALTRYKLFMMRQADIALRVPLKDIASYLEITPQSLSRIRKNMM